MYAEARQRIANRLRWFGAWSSIAIGPLSRDTQLMIMNTETLGAIQLPLKERYRTDPDAAQIALKAEGRIGQGLTSPSSAG
jgi:hypothetical protein